ncbi:hypothetical protein NC652_037918 [Populus alba x Populus x berolinensis]|nr:hypothetical protein NC652_037918 [Populus alba x Populus x berolinensis]
MLFEDKEVFQTHQIAVVVEDIATREEQEDLANVKTFIKLRRKSNLNKRLYLLIYGIGLSEV